MVVTENIVKEILSLPIYPELKKCETEKVIRSIENFFTNEIN